MGSANSLSQMTNAGQVLAGYVENQWGTGTGFAPNDTPIANRFATRMDLVVPSNPNTLVAYNTFGDPGSGRKWNWIGPASVTTAAGFKNDLYKIELWSGNPTTSNAVYIDQTVGKDAIPGVAGWVFNYDQGLLLVSDDLISIVGGSTGNATYPAGTEFHIRGWRYIGAMGLGGSGSQGTQGTAGSGSQGTRKS